MTLTRRLRVAALTAALTGMAAQAQAAPQQPARVVPVAPCPPAPCPPGQLMPVPSTPGQPGAAPVVPYTPGTPSTPSTPGTPDGPTPPATPPSTPAPPSTPPAPSSDLSASATAGQGGGAAEGSAKPGIFGDLFGGGAIRAPYYARFDSQGRLIGQAPRVVGPDGVSRPLANTLAGVTTGGRTAGVVRPTDELLFGQTGTSPEGTPVAFTRAVGNIDPRDAVLLPVLPSFNRGAFKITENETPRPTTRAYVTYNFYDNLFKSQGADSPRIMLHQQNFGYEQAFGDQRYSVGLRLPYNQLVSAGYLNDTSVGDLTIVTKAVISENRATGDLLSGGLAITTPTGGLPTGGVFGRTVPRNTVLQPYLGYILNSGDWFLQGFSGLLVPTDSADVTIYSQSLALGYSLFTRPGASLSGIYPVFEAHLNTPLNHRGLDPADPVSFPDTLTLLGGTFFEFYSRSTLGFAAGAPVTGPRPFSLQATVQLSIRF